MCAVITGLVICIGLGALRWHAHRQHRRCIAEMTARGDELDAILRQLRQLSAAGADCRLIEEHADATAKL